MNDVFLRSATLADLDELVLLEKLVEHSLPSRDIFATDEKNFYEPIVHGAGHILLAFDAKRHLAGASVIRYPPPEDPENLGHTLSLPEAKLRTVRHLESVFVRPDLQGKGLAEHLVRENMRLTDRAGRHLSLATVWPGNAASLKLHLRLGLYIRAFALKYGGKARFILMNEGSPDMGAEPVFVQAMDMERHRELLASSMLGVAVHHTQNALFVEYRPCHST